VRPLPSFDAFFRELWGYVPFPWQSMLAGRVASGAWPEALDLPTASGKTACIEIALYALAAQAERATADRTAPRRVWFVVDRRIVVDEAFDRATEIAERLAGAADGPLLGVAERLREIAGTDRPLAVARLRGGVFRDDGWARLPSQPAVITSTVDQLGSRLLFRGYGRSQLTAPIFAGLAGSDSLVLLDEAHCSVPFLQTVHSVEEYRSPRWAEKPVVVPFSLAILSATPPKEIAPESVFPGALRRTALDHPVLRQRLAASKRAELVPVRAKGMKAKAKGEDPLVTEAVERAAALVGHGKRRVAIMVNRVATAESIHGALRSKLVENADVVLMTGRMRPFDRDALVARWKRYLEAASPDEPARSIALVSTQCLEVGADFSFDALVTEAASLDALRQRFGRLDRMGTLGASNAAILIREEDGDPEKSDPDPIYGPALAKTWKLLEEHASDQVIDFGIDALDAALSDVEDPSEFRAPAGEAPVLLPAHLDLLCQTAPSPRPEPDVALFLHGKDRGAPEVRVLWRADLAYDGSDDDWIETLALCPPASAEMLSVPLYRLRAFLSGWARRDDLSDIEGAPEPKKRRSKGGGNATTRWAVWRGRDKSEVLRNASDVRPRDVVVLPADRGTAGLGQVAGDGLGKGRLDIWEAVLSGAGRQAAVRLHRALLEPWIECPPVAALLQTVEAPEPNREDIRDAVDALLAYRPEDEGSAGAPPAWWLDALDSARGGRLEQHPAGGAVLVKSGPVLRKAEPDLFADDDDLTSWSGEEMSLDEHSDLVRRTAGESIARRCLPEEYWPLLSLAAYWHDAGKLDERFQVLLHNGDELRAISSDMPLAKSKRIPSSPARRRFIREASGLPPSFRHEMLSAELAARHAPLPDDPHAHDLVLHLIASHHGHARPFAPVSPDPSPPSVLGRLGTTRIAMSAEDRAAVPPAHRMDSGIPDRFWRLVRRYGWWGLAYLEAVLRLADWYASGTEKVDEEAVT
jgi:CRISPR-associated endonuclease/helicase Cas3